MQCYLIGLLNLTWKLTLAQTTEVYLFKKEKNN